MAEHEVYSETTAAPGMTPKRLRYLFAGDLFHMIPEIGTDMLGRPTEQEPTLSFIDRMLAGGTPEEGVTSAAHALQPQQAVLWAMECLQGLSGALNPNDQHLLSLVNRWLHENDEASREEALRASMDAEVKTPGVWMAFAAACSESPSNQNNEDGEKAPEHLTGRAINASILSALARIDLNARRRKLSEMVGMAKVFASGH